MTRQELESLGFSDGEIAAEHEQMFRARPALDDAAPDTPDLQAVRAKAWGNLAVRWFGQVTERAGAKIGPYAEVRGR